MEKEKKLSKRDRKGKGPRPMDFSKYAERHVLLKLAYVGKNYAGLEAQKHLSNTVEEELFRALKQMRLIQDEKSCNYRKCGRTDKGVSALGNAVSLTMRSLKHKEDFV